MLNVVDRVLEKSKIAVLTTVDSNGAPHMRWMTPALIRGRDGFLYAVTSPDFEKAADVDENPRVEWMVQTKSLDEIINIRGTMAVLDNPSAKADVLEAIGGHLGTFWKVNPDETKLVVLETTMEQIVYFRPVKGDRTVVDIGVENG